MALASAVSALLELSPAAPIDQCEGCFATVSAAYAYEAQPAVESADLISALAVRLMDVRKDAMDGRKKTVYVCMYVCVCVCVCMYVCVCVYVCMYVCIGMCPLVSATPLKLHKKTLPC
jgi:hypothetical protein